MAVILVVGVWLATALLPGAAARWVFASLETEWNVSGRAAQVDFNPLTLQVELRDLSLAATATATEPFLTVETLTVDLPWSALFGTPAVDLVDVVAPVLTVRRSEGGASNLPTFPPGSPGEEAPGTPWRVGAVTGRHHLHSQTRQRE